MRIAMTASALPSEDQSGVPYQAHHLANALIGAGHDVTVFSMSPHPAGALYEHRQLRRHRRLTIWLWAYQLRQQDFRGFDVLHCHGDDCLLALKRRPWHVRTFHGSSWAECRACDDPRHKLRIAALAVGEFASLAVADLCIANSRQTMRYFPGLRHYIPCGVDLQVFQPGSCKSPDPSILFVGGIHGKKRGGLLHRMFLDEIRPAVPAAQLWVVAGERVEGPGVHFCGKVDSATLVDLYQRAWVFCMPSSYEGFGVPYVEAMACGTPVVATHNAGAREVLDEGRFGVLCNDDELSAKLVWLLRTEEARRFYEEMGVERARRFDWQRVTTDYLAAYRGETWAQD